MKTRTLLAALLLTASLFGLFGVTSYAADVDTVQVSSQNSAPIAEDFDLITYRSTSVKSSFKAVDPDGDAVVFSIVEQPGKGTIAICDESFIYTPADKKKGKDSFTYIATDTMGNASKPATVSICIEKQGTKVTYADLCGAGLECAAVTLAEYDVFIGDKIGDGYYFCADNAVTRGEFLAMCMELAGADTLSDITRTGFADDADMPLWVKPYVSTALLNGLISGYTTESGSLVFSSGAPITSYEAAVMLNNILGITDVVSVSAMDYAGSAPVWASQAVINLRACSICGTASEQPLTRGTAADKVQ